MSGPDNVGSILRSSKDTAFLQNGLLHQKVARICREKVRGRLLALKPV